MASRSRQGRQPQGGGQAPWLDPTQWPAAVEGSFATVLKAVGQLLVAIGGEARPAPARRAARPAPSRAGEPAPPPVAAAEPPAPHAPAAAPAAPRVEEAMTEPLGEPFSEPPGEQFNEQPRPAEGVAPSAEAGAGPDDAIAAVLADARARAQQIIDESVAQAEALLREREGAALSAEQQAIERVRRTVTDIVADVRLLHGRLDAIESLLRARLPAQPAPPPAPAASPPPAVEAAPPPLAASPPPPPVAAPPPAPSAPPAAEVTFAAPPPPAAPAPPPPVAERPEPTPITRGVADTEVRPNGSSAPPETFAPEGGSVLMRVWPVSGFQGLMRVQDALVRLRGIREAGVEAYSQGEARLRLQISEPLDPAWLAAALGESLGQTASLEGSSLPDRSLEVALG